MGGQFGGGFGAGFSQGVEDEIEFERKRQLEKEKREYEEEVRAEARGFSTSERIAQQDFSAGQKSAAQDFSARQSAESQLNADRRTESGRQLARAIVQEGREYAQGLADEAEQDEIAQARQMFDTRLTGMFQQWEPREGEPMSQEQRQYAEIKMQAMQGYRPGMNIAGVSDLLFNAEKGIQVASEQQDLQDMQNSVTALMAPDENGVPLATEQELAQLDALMQAGDPVQFQAGISDVIGSYERRVAREGAFQGVAGMVAQSIEAWNAAPMPVNVYGEGDEKTYSEWRNMQQGHILAAVKKEELFRNIMGENYDPFAGQDRITELIQQVDPVTARLVRERDERLRLESMTAEERIKAEADFLGKSESARDWSARTDAVGAAAPVDRTGDPKVDLPAMRHEAQARIAAGDVEGARKLIAQMHQITKPKQ
jgi:hypothetical protein